MKKLILIGLLLLLCIVVFPIQASPTCECPNCEVIHGACPAHDGDTNLACWEDFGPSVELCGAPPDNHYYECQYGACSPGTLHSVYHCGAALEEGECMGGIWEISHGLSTILLDPENTMVPPIASAGGFDYFAFTSTGDYHFFNTVNYPNGEPLIVSDCTPTIPYNFTTNVTDVWIDGQLVPLQSLIPICSFSAVPRTGDSPLLVTFKDTTPNIVNPDIMTTFWSWLVYYTGTQDIALSSNKQEWSGRVTGDDQGYDISYLVSNLAGVCLKSEPDYIHTTGYATTYGVIVNLDVKNAITGALIQDTEVGIQNTTSGVWRNSTISTGLVYFDSTDPGWLYPLSINQTIKLAASRYGYQDANITFAIPYSGYHTYLYLIPNTVVPAEGTGTVIATVVRNKDGLPISGASVVLDTEQMGTTNSAGATTFMNVTAGDRSATVSTPTYGYLTTTKAFTLTAGETKMVIIQMVLSGETPVPTFVSPTPTPTIGTGAAGNYTSGQLNQRGSVGLMGMMEALFQLWPIAILLVLYKAVKSVLE